MGDITAATKTITTHLGIGHIGRQVIERIQERRKALFHIGIRQRRWMQDGQESRNQLAFARPLVECERDGFLDNLGVILFTAQFRQRANDFIAIGGIKVLVQALGQLMFKFDARQQGSINRFGRLRIVSSLVFEL